MGAELMGEVEPGGMSQRQRRVWRLRDRVFVVLTANVAWVWALATPWLIEKSQILEVNSARAFLLLLTPMEQSGGAVAGSYPPAARGTGHRESRPQPSDKSGAVTAEELRKLVERQIPAVEFIVYIWKRVMWCTAGLIGLAALLAAVTGWTRFFHLLVVAVILLSTAITLVSMQLLIHQDYGGMEPLPIRSHVYVCAGLSAYAWVLLLAFARRPVRGDTKSSRIGSERAGVATQER